MVFGTWLVLTFERRVGNQDIGYPQIERFWGAGCRDLPVKKRYWRKVALHTKGSPGVTGALQRLYYPCNGILERDVDSVINCGEAKEMWDLVLALFSVSWVFQDGVQLFWLVGEAVEWGNA
ncbi:hypothetical protein Acr_14g0005340 [Actinidia rufa]|uniref:Uncharacterized protein n=1 Tax=Actinidia rufa TaxID=165716 RepID=A0A7J0FQA1_9ERIC|nr:hypothetical protein Acr_14g0005340 [Actinidia rufa]